MDVMYMYNYLPPQPQYNQNAGFNYVDPTEYIRKIERRKLKKTSNGLGFYIMAYYLTMQIVGVIVVTVLELFGVSPTEPTVEYLLDILLSVLAAFVPGIIYLAASGFKFGEAYKKTFVPITLLISLVFIGMGLAMVSNTAAQLMDENLSLFGLKNSVSMTNDSLLNPFQTILYMFAVSAVPAFAEEFAFRGIVMGRLKKYGKCFAVIASSVMFGAMHGNTTQIVFAFILGLVFGFVDMIADSILPSIIIHFINNFYAVTFDVLRSNTNIDEHTYYLINLVVVVIFCIGGLLSFIYLVKKDKSIFKFSSTEKSEEAEADLLTYKEKIKSFFLTPGVIISLSMFLILTIYFLLPNGLLN